MKSSPEDLRALAEVHEAMAAMLSLFESGVPEAAAIEAATVRSAETFEAYRALRGERSREELGEEVLRALESCRRLNAVVSALLGERRAELTQERSLLQRARLHLQELKSVVSHGGSCDVAG